MKISVSHLPAAVPPTSTLVITRPGLCVRMSAQSRFSKRARRQILLALFRAARTVLEDLDGFDVYHSDAGPLSQSADLGKTASLHQALAVDTDERAEGMNIRLRRLFFRLTQAEFAKRAGISRPHLSRIEHGKIAIEALTRQKIALAFRLVAVSARNRKLQSATPQAQVARRGMGPRFGGSDASRGARA